MNGLIHLGEKIMKEEKGQEQLKRYYQTVN